MQHAWYIIANPQAGNGAVQKPLDSMQYALRTAGIDFLLKYTNARQHAIQLVEEAVSKGYRKIIAIGGDGTNNEVVNGIMRQNVVPSSAITYALFPCGTGNDWIKEYSIPKVLANWVTMLQQGKTFVQDIGWASYTHQGNIQERYFVNVAGMSYDAFVVNEMSRLKRPVKNRLEYLLYGLYYVFHYRIPKARVYFNQETYEGYYYLINAGICRYSGGGMQLVPHAVPDDSRLAVTLAGRLSKLGILINSYRFYNGTIAGHPKVQIFHTDHIRVEDLGVPVALEVDGEVLGTTPVEMRIIPKALKFIIP